MTTIENYTERSYPGSPIRIVSWTDGNLISINVFVGAERSDLSRTFAIGQREAAATHYAYVQNGARAGRSEAALIADLARTPVTATLEQTAPTPDTRPVRNTRTNVFTQPLTDAQARLVETARQGTTGIITCNDAASWLTLRAIVDKGHATVISKATTGKILAIQVRA